MPEEKHSYSHGKELPAGLRAGGSDGRAAAMTAMRVGRTADAFMDVWLPRRYV